MKPCLCCLCGWLLPSIPLSQVMHHYVLDVSGQLQWSWLYALYGVNPFAKVFQRHLCNSNSWCWCHLAISYKCSLEDDWMRYFLILATSSILSTSLVSKMIKEAACSGLHFKTIIHLCQTVKWTRVAKEWSPQLITRTECQIESLGLQKVTRPFGLWSQCLPTGQTPTESKFWLCSFVNAAAAGKVGST